MSIAHIALGTLALATAASALQLAPHARPTLPAPRPTPRRAAAAVAMADEAAAEPDGLVARATMSAEYLTMVEGALAQRNKERILAGQPVYEDLQAMINSYIEFEGRDKGMSDAACEDAVIRYLQRKALLDEGGYEGDPQELVTFALLGALLLGGAYQIFLNGGLPDIS